MTEERTLVERLRDESIVGMPMEKEAADRIEEMEARYHREQDRIERLIKENQSLRESLEIWIFHSQRAMGEKPEVARQYAKAWMFRNAGGKEPE